MKTAVMVGLFCFAGVGFILLAGQFVLDLVAIGAGRSDLMDAPLPCWTGAAVLAALIAAASVEVFWRD